ncbi:MAG: lysine--tRNA ligase, partial [Firmicutes bacterium]|nr:lysine--tRNA ligase [Bacillota bacterium]
MSEEKNMTQAPAVEEMDLNEQRRIRREKLAKLQEMGRDPYLHETWAVDSDSKQIKDNFEEMEGKHVVIAGRMMAKRNMGKASFIDIQDKSGRIQGYVRQDAITPEEYQIFVTYDLGDIVGVEGEVFKTRHGEISVKVEKIVLLSKCLQPLPEKYHGLKDQDQRYRQRYVDLIVNPEVVETFRKRTAIIHEIRR